MAATGCAGKDDTYLCDKPLDWCGEELHWGAAVPLVVARLELELGEVARHRSEAHLTRLAAHLAPEVVDLAPLAPAERAPAHTLGPEHHHPHADAVRPMRRRSCRRQTRQIYIRRRSALLQSARSPCVTTSAESGGVQGAGAYMPGRARGRWPPLRSLDTSLHTDCFSATFSTRGIVRAGGEPPPPVRPLLQVTAQLVGNAQFVAEPQKATRGEARPSRGV